MNSTSKTLNMLRAGLCIAAALAVAACGGGASIGGTLTGMNSGSTIVLENNSTDDITLTSNQTFSFPTTVAAGSTYNVTVLTQPTGQTCTVANGSGTVDSLGTAVTGISVTCSASAQVDVTVTGLTTGLGLTLYLNGSNPLQLTQTGTYAFSGVLAAGSTYSVTVATQPAGQVCTVTNGTGTIQSGVTVTANVNCV